MYKEKDLGKIWLSYGHNFKQIGVGLFIDKYRISIDVVFFFIVLEYK
jgi:hypothetical protein